MSYDPVNQPETRAFKFLAFDIGDTLIRTSSLFTGPMYTWPKIIPVNGAEEMLTSLQKKYQLIAATNTMESSSSEIRAALDRCELGKYFSYIFTAKDIGKGKPDTEFFKSITDSLNIKPRFITMIGDSFNQDIMGAYLSGWKSIWFNPAHRLCPMLHPWHQAEIANLCELSDHLKNLSLPSLNDCFNIFMHMNASYHLLQHVQTVAAISYVLASWLKSTGESVDPILAHRGGLLHDLAKSEEIRNKTADHGMIAGNYLVSLGQHELAGIARKHILPRIIDKDEAPSTLEEKIVYYADKLVEGGDLVSLSDRLEALNQRYQIGQKYNKAIIQLQDELCNKLCLTADEMQVKLKKSLFGQNSENLIV